MKLPADLPRRPAAEGVRLVTLGLLDAVERQAERLADPSDAEALHDFRVALRRLRSTLRTWKGELEESVRRSDRKALRALQAGTGGGRDAEVALGWIEAQREGLDARHGAGLEHAAGLQRARLEGPHQEAVAELRKDLAQVAERLRARLPRRVLVRYLDRPLEEPGWALVLSRKAQREARVLAQALGEVRSAHDVDELHAARIEGKRLRYLLEPARAWSEEALLLVTRLKQLQDALGEMHDAHVLSDELARARNAGEDLHQAGLAELARRNEARLQALFARLGEDGSTGGMATLLGQVDGFANSFAALGRAEVERERKFLLDGLPTLPEDAETLEIEQGWLPGVRLRERLRRVVGPAGERLERALKLGQGVERTEVEEPLAPELFARLWPLTEGCRVRKRRHRVRAGSHVWEIDEFLDRELVLAEVELEHVDERPRAPAWLAAHVVREVTEEGAYVNLALAEAGPGAVPG